MQNWIRLLCVLWLCVPLTVLSQTFTGMTPEVFKGSTDAQGIISFKAIPFAAAPIDELRWQAPKPYIAQDQITSADQFAPICMQGPDLVNWYKDLIKSIGKNPDIFSHPEGGYSEDCLYLNIWTKDMDDLASKPVMVWIHGGSNTGGWSYEPDYRGFNLANKDVVVVSIAYRVGVFGNFSHPELISEQAGKAGNYGLLDLVAALEWVQRYIGDFGGDANNVTLFGESAGAANIGYLLSSPNAKGLFHRAIHQSAGYEISQESTLTELTKTGLAIAKESHVTNITALRLLNSKALLQAVDDLPAKPDFGPVTNGHGLPESAKSVFDSARQNNVPLMIGTNANEWLMYIDDADTIDSYLNFYDLSEKKNDIHALLGKLKREQQLDRIGTAVEMLCPSFRMASAVSLKQSAYVYQMTRVRTGNHWQSIGAYHGAEIPYVFDTHASWLTTNADDRKLTKMMQKYWVNFAKTGNPNEAGLPTWENFNSHNKQVLALGDQVQMKIAPDLDLCRIVDS